MGNNGYLRNLFWRVVAIAEWSATVYFALLDDND